MGVVNAASAVTARLNEFEGKYIGLLFDGIAEGVTSQVPVDGGEIEERTDDVVRAQIVLFEDGEAKPLGATLVYPKVIASNLRTRPTDWQVGRLTSQTHKTRQDWKYYLLEPMPDDVFKAAAAALEAARLV